MRVANVPLSTKKKDLEEKFLDFGQVKRVWIVPGIVTTVIIDAIVLCARPKISFLFFFFLFWRV